MATARVPRFISFIAFLGAHFIYALNWLFGKRFAREELPWLSGPVGGAVIGDAPFQEIAVAETLSVERNAVVGGLLGSWEKLRSSAFNPDELHPEIQAFYLDTCQFTMDVWSQTYFPSNLALWALVKTISRMVNQLNFPLSPLETAKGLLSEIVHLRTPDGQIRYTGWFRSLAEENHVLYTGFYMTEMAPKLGVPCVKVVFPMPLGNATVLLQPKLTPDGGLILDSSGRKFGDAGFYRIQKIGAEQFRVWHIKTLKEHFHVYVDERATLRCDHIVRFLGLPVLKLHYKISRKLS